MKQRSYSLNGKTNSKGQLLISDKLSFDEFFKQWPNARFVGVFFVSDPGSSELLMNYYIYKIVPDVRRAMWELGDRKTLTETEEFCRQQCPILIEETYDFTTGNYDTRLRDLKELDNQELVFFVEHIKQFAAEELSIFIEDPRVLTK